MQPLPDEMPVQTKGKQGHTASSRQHNMQQAYIFATRDFGIVLRASPSLTTRYAAHGAAKFTAQYLAPESLSICVSTTRIIIVQRIGMSKLSFSAAECG
jgi:hypothetical protein